MASQDERVQRIVGDLRSLVEEMTAAATERTRAAEAEATEHVARWHDATQELAEARAEISRMEKERESIPDRAYRAGLDERWEEEDELKERYRNLKPALETLRDRVAGLEAEVRALAGPNPATPEGTVYDAEIAAYTTVRDAYSEEVAPLAALQREVAAILRDPVDELSASHRYWGQTLQGIRDQRAGDPEVVEARAEKEQRRRQARVRAIGA